jgi:hypothetical protein
MGARDGLNSILAAPKRCAAADQNGEDSAISPQAKRSRGAATDPIAVSDSITVSDDNDFEIQSSDEGLQPPKANFLQKTSHKILQSF